MAAPAKAIIVAIIASALLVLLTHLAFFFPFYMTMVLETFKLANVAANDNYVRQSYYDQSFDDLTGYPMFAKSRSWTPGDGWNTGNVRIRVLNADDERAVGSDYSYDYSDIDGTIGKPYRQRGEKIKVEIVAAYPFEMKMWNETYHRAIPVSFSITVIGLKYYKDLDYYDLY